MPHQPLNPYTQKDIQEKVVAKLDEQKGLSFLEQYAMYMGKAQMLEFGLKGLVHRKFNVPISDMERWTLGMTKNELAKQGIRQDFVACLERVLKHRNDMAHEFLLNCAVMNSLGNFSGKGEAGDLFRASYELEQIILLHDWCEEHDAWT
ncbi:hypothetical protein CSV86_014530 [Pseudomonas putida CSV86]|uniref:Uncharacterized protein n=1 Tax=Pseudomonas bharatica CSV86 TaxID=1005395 RepID=A0A7K4EF92_9PSED|nr:hypothetical protein [Pseudomonas bharatica]NNJ16342.1 hypothetical protein [Pseudomonas bharatica CSV86]